MKRKVLAMMMSLTLAMAVTACGGSDTETDAADTAVEETVDDTAEADEAEAEDVAAEDATEEARGSWTVVLYRSSSSTGCSRNNLAFRRCYA